MNKYANYVNERLTKQTLFEQLAEESCELGKASLKMIRATGQNDNFTPKTPAEAYKEFIEELNDVLMVASLLVTEEYLQSAVNDVDNNTKWKRWAYRIGYNKIGLED